MYEIVENKIMCVHCRDIIESKSVHDFKICKCGRVAVDGGHEYLRRCGDLNDFIDLSVTREIEKPLTLDLEKKDGRDWKEGY